MTLLLFLKYFLAVVWVAYSAVYIAVIVRRRAAYYRQEAVVTAIGAALLTWAILGML